MSSRPAPGALVVTGTRTEGDAPNRFSEQIDLRAKAWKRTQQMGEGESQSGFDSLPWGASNNGIVTVSNLPSAVADKRAEAWLETTGWQTRASRGERSRRIAQPGASPVNLTFDPTSGRIEKAEIDGDWGIVSVSYSDWRRVGPFTYPFRREEVSPTGERVITQVESADARVRLPARALARPLPHSHAELDGTASATVPFLKKGARKTHIFVDATINNQPARLIFDTGAANYITTEAAPDFALHPTGGINLSGPGEGSAAGGYATLDRIALGRAALRNETIVVGPAPWPPAPKGQRPEVAGLTGYEFVAEYVTTIDYPAQELRFAKALPHEPRAIRLPFYNDEFHMYVRARVNGVEGLFGIDTGDGGSVTIFPEFAARAKIHGSAPAAGDGGGIGGAVKNSAGTIGRFAFAGLNFDQLPARFSENKTGAFASKSIAGNLGGGILQCFSITIDFAHRLLLFVPEPKSPTCAPGGTVSFQ